MRKAKLSKLDAYEILNALRNKYYDINQTLKFLNYGGCGMFAEHLYNTLIELGFKPSFVVLTNNSKQMTEFINGDIGDDDNDGYVKHIIIKVAGYYLDSQRLSYTVEGFGYGKTYADNLKIRLLRKWNQEHWRWNETFDRSQEYLIIKRLNTAKNLVKKEHKKKLALLK